MKLVLMGLMFVLLFINCNKPFKDTPKKDLTKIQVHPGKKLMEVHCYSCHHPTASEENRLAPPMIAIKQHYSFLGLFIFGEKLLRHKFHFVTGFLVFLGSWASGFL